MEICTMTINNPPKFGKKEINIERKLPFWIPVSDAHTKAKAIKLTRKLNLSTGAKNQQEAEAKISGFLSQLGLEIINKEM